MMRIPKQSLLIFLFLGFHLNALHACNCEPALQLSADGWNDADIIFTATLLEHKMGIVGMLEFEPRKMYKGEMDAAVTFYFQPGKDHTLLHAVRKFSPGDEWIVFARKTVRGGRVYYRLKESPLRSVCALSRPLEEDREKDPYLLFLDGMAQKADGYQKIFDEGGQLVAEGEYARQIPVSRWAYYEPGRNMKILGNYAGGQREGEWLQLKERPNNEIQIIRKTIYKNGAPAEIHDYSHTGTVSLRKILTDSTEVRHYFRDDGTLKSKITVHFENNTTHILNCFDNGAIQEERVLKGDKVMRQYWYDETGKLAREWVEEKEN